MKEIIYFFNYFILYIVRLMYLKEIIVQNLK